MPKTNTQAKLMTLPRPFIIKTQLSDAELKCFSASIIDEISTDIHSKLMDFYGGDNGDGIKCDDDLKELMNGHTPGSGAWSDCFCPDLESAEVMTPYYFALCMKAIIHIQDGGITIEEQGKSFAFQEQYDFLFKKLSRVTQGRT
jgi:hypothetical protein